MEQKNYIRLADIEAYRHSFHLSNQIWKVILSWDHFSKDTIGKQFVRAIDSISANIAEGFGRYNKKDKIKFYRIARGSVYECLDFNEKAKIRGLFTTEQYTYFFEQLQLLPKAIHALIKFTNATLKE